MWLYSFWGHICARTCMHTFLEGVTSNFGCLRGNIGVVIKKDFSLIPRFYFLKAEYIWVLFLQLVNLKWYLKERKHICYSHHLKCIFSTALHWPFPECLRLGGFSLQSCHLSLSEGSGSHCPSAQGQAAALVEWGSPSPRGGSPSFSLQSFTSFIPSLLSVFDPLLLPHPLCRWRRLKRSFSLDIPEFY